MVADDILSTIVELSVAVAGFSGVVAALAPTRPSLWSPFARGLFSALLVSTMVSASIALLAMVLLASPVSSANAWAIASAAHGMFLVGVLAVRTRQPRPAGMSVAPSVIAIAVALAVIALVQLANASLFQSAWICVGALSLYAAMGFGYFVLLVQTAWETSPAAQQADEPDVE